MQNPSPLSSFNTILAQLTKKNQKYTDPEFPSDKRSLFQETPDTSKYSDRAWSSYQFARLASLAKRNVRLFKGSVTPISIEQTNLGKYFISALSTLSESQDYIPRLFHQIESNSAGVYGIWICDNGEWRLITIDDTVPCVEENGELVPAFSKSKSGELWVALLEKAYAKVHGSFENIKEGFAEYVLRDLTGAPYTTLFSEKDAHKVWAFVKRGHDNNFIAVCTYKKEQDEPGSYAYTILATREVYNDQGKHRILCIRNPWNSFSLEGDWSLNSELWTEELRDTCKYYGDDETIFWISIKDFVKHFEDVSVLEVRKDYYYSSVKCDHSQNLPNFTVFRLHVSKASNVSISLVQKDERDFSNLQNSNYTYSFGRILIGRITPDGLIYKNGVADQAREMQCGGYFDEGAYIVAVEMHWVQNFYKLFNVTFYTENQVTIEGVKDADLLAIQKNLIKSIIATAPPKDQNTDDYSSVDEPNVTRISGLIHGMLYFAYSNNSLQNTKISETVDVKGKNLKICPPFTKNNSFFISVNPGNEIIVLIKIMSINHAYQLSFNYTAQTSTEIEDSEITQALNPAHYKYIDNPSKKFVVDVNDFYNQYIRQKKVELKEFVEDEAEVVIEEQKIETAIEQVNEISVIQEKPPKVYPEIELVAGEFISRKIPFFNFSQRATKLMAISSSDDSIVHVKNTELEIPAQENGDIRLRFTAPAIPGAYEVDVQLTNVNNPEEPPEILHFIVIAHEK